MGAILVVEDDPDAREIFSEVLRVEGHAVTVAENGYAALRQLRRGSFDVVLLDLMMPVMSGWELRAAMLRDTRLAEIPVVILTGDVTSSREDWSLCATGYVPKPVSFVALHCAVKRALSLRDLGSGPALDRAPGQECA